jgi:hypothetical protein
MTSEKCINTDFALFSVLYIQLTITKKAVFLAIHFYSTKYAIKVLYRERVALVNRGVEEIKLVKGYSAQAAEDAKKASVIEYLVETTVQIEMLLTPIEKIEIGKI